MTDLVLEFNQIISTLLRKVEQKSRNDDELASLDRVQKRINLLKSTMGIESLIDIAAPVILRYSGPIMSNDENFFTTMDVRAESINNGITITADDEYIFSLIDSVKAHYVKLGSDEKKKIFIDINKLLNLSARWSKSKVTV